MAAYTFRCVCVCVCVYGRLVVRVNAFVCVLKKWKKLDYMCAGSGSILNPAGAVCVWEDSTQQQRASLDLIVVSRFIQLHTQNFSPFLAHSFRHNPVSIPNGTQVTK